MKFNKKIIPTFIIILFTLILTYLSQIYSYLKWTFFIVIIILLTVLNFSKLKKKINLTFINLIVGIFAAFIFGSIFYTPFVIKNIEPPIFNVTTESVDPNQKCAHLYGSPNIVLQKGTVGILAKPDYSRITKPATLISLKNIFNLTFVEVYFTPQRTVQYSIIDDFGKKYELPIADNISSQWIFVAIRWDEYEASIVIDGNKSYRIKLDNPSFTRNITGWQIGADYLHKYCFIGSVSEVGVWNKYLTDRQLAGMYNGSIDSYCEFESKCWNNLDLSEGLEAYYPFSNETS